MRKGNLEHINRALTEEQRTRHEGIREGAIKEFPPKALTNPKPSAPGIPAEIRQARETRGLTWYALAKLAQLPNSRIVRDIERGKDVKLSHLQAVASALHLKLELVEELT